MYNIVYDDDAIKIKAICFEEKKRTSCYGLVIVAKRNFFCDLSLTGINVKVYAFIVSSTAHFVDYLYTDH